MDVKIKEQGEVVSVIFWTPSLSSTEQIAAVTKKIMDYLEEKKPMKVIVDFAKVKFFSSQVLGLLLQIRAKQKIIDGQVVISSIDPQLHRVFKITNLDTIFRFFPDEDAAKIALA